MFSTEQIKQLIRSGREREFYQQRYWRKLSSQIKKEQNNECYFCKRRGKYTPARLVHHRYELVDYPEFAYKRYYIDALGVQHINLVACCYTCHEEQHHRGAFTESKHFDNVERW